MKNALFHALAGFLFLSASPSALSQNADGGPTRVTVGDRLPAAVLSTVEGKEMKLAEIVAEKPTVLIFYRGGWCPYCTKHLSALAGIQEDLDKLGIQILAVSPDQPSKLREKPDNAKIPYQLLSDRTMEAAKAFGIAFEVDADMRDKYRGFGIDLEAASGEAHHLLPHPAVYVIDAKGIIRFAHVNEDYKVRLEAEKVLEAAREVTP